MKLRRHPGEEVGCQAIDGVISHLDCLLVVLELEEGDGRTKSLFLVDLQGVQKAAPECPQQHTMARCRSLPIDFNKGTWDLQHSNCHPATPTTYAALDMQCFAIAVQLSKVPRDTNAVRCEVPGGCSHEQHWSTKALPRLPGKHLNPSISFRMQNMHVPAPSWRRPRALNCHPEHNRMPHRHLNGALIQDSGAEEVALVHGRRQ